uniref:BglG family transcription antiterminator n=1 Tax=Candidatus Enterococcus willemsii TaxID=1857215 RepID=UPI00403FA2F3
MLDYHLQKLFQKKFYGSCFSLEELALYIEIDPQRLYKQIQEVNHFLKKKKQPEFRFVNDNLQFPEKIIFSWAELKFLTAHYDVIFTEIERQQLIFLYCFLEVDNLSVYHFQDLLQVSKNTILADIKKLRECLNKQAITLDYQRKKGFYLVGNELDIRVLGRNFVSELLDSQSGYWGLTTLQEKLEANEYLHYRQQLKQALQKANLTVVPSRVEEVAHYIVLLSGRVRQHRVLFSADERQLLVSLQAVKVAQYFMSETSQFDYPNEELFLTALVMTVVEGSIQDPALDYLLQGAGQIVQRIQSFSAIDFKDRNQTILHVFYHLVPSFFRIYFGFHLPNAWTDTVKRQHNELFKLTKVALKPLEQLANKEIPDNEVAYFTILFGGERENQKEELTRQVRALILCPNGISSSLIMQAELKQLFPSIDFSLTNSVKELENIPEENYDVIFSNTALSSDKPTYVVQPIMSIEEKQRLLVTVQEELLLPGMAVLAPEQILKIIEPYVHLREGVNTDKLLEVLTKRMTTLQKKKEDHRPMLSELITADTIQLTEEQLTWEQAIEMAAKPLLNQGNITKDYITAMIDKVKEYGAFIHIGKNIALPHARPEDGVKKLGMSLLKTSHPVLLLDNEKHAINIFICLAAVDNDAHLRALASLTKILSNANNLERLLAATTKEEIQEILKGEE